MRALFEVKNLAEYESRLLTETDAKHALEHLKRVLERIARHVDKATQ